MPTQLLSDGWQVRPSGDLADVPADLRSVQVPAPVPGCVHSALLAAGLIPDPYLADHEARQHWIGRTDWVYRCVFTPDPAVLAAPHVDLVCEGLDTVATITLNGAPVGQSENMHVAVEWDVKPLLRAGANELEIAFASPVRYARAQQARLGKLPYLNCAEPFNFIRKMACNFGWDWGPALTTSGPWRPVSLRAWNGGRIRQVRSFVAGFHGQQAELVVAVDYDLSDPSQAMAVVPSLVGPSGEAGEAHVGVLRRTAGHITFGVVVPKAKKWWPRGYGDQPLYTLAVELVDPAAPAGAAPLDRWQRRIGLRTVELDTAADDIGSKFTLKVNGQPVFCKGANWIPDDCLLDRACTPARYRTRIEQALAANMNMLRVWGGGIYETDAFYDLCDELGVLVWQDFLFACAAYPEEEPFRTLVEQEARTNVARLMHHPSLVLWNGCNENLWGYFDWGWKTLGRVKGRTWGLGYYLDLLPKVCKELDPARPYWPASPFSGRWDPDARPGGAEDTSGEHLHPNSSRHGNKHVWEAWFGGEYSVYRQFVPRFCSEFGFQAPPTWATLERAIGREQLYAGAPLLAAHQKSDGGDKRNDRHLAAYFDTARLLEPNDPAARRATFDDWQYLLQVNQARALTLAVEWWRSHSPTCMGTLYWQLNDCWPAVSWSAIDGDGRLKPLWYATRRFYAPRLLTIQPEGNGLVLCAVNDTAEPWAGEATVRLVDFAGQAGQAGERFAMRAEPRSVARIPLSNPAATQPSDADARCLVASLDGRRALWFYARDKELAYPPAQFDATLEPRPGGYALHLAAHTLVRDLCLFVDRLDPAATVDDQYVTLLPGEALTLMICTGRTLTLADLTAPPVLQSVNRFGRPAEKL